MRRPTGRRDGELREVSWDEAFGAVAEGLRPVIEEHGPNAVAVVLGNPNVHTVAGALYPPVLLRALGTRNLYTASTVDQMPKHVSSGLMFGDPFAIPVPDLDRTDHLLLIGANPLDSNGSLCSWGRAISVGLAGIFGGYLAPFLDLQKIIQWFGSSAEQSTIVIESINTTSGVTITSVQAQVSDQPLLWYRLIPNATYGPGILIALLFACIPLVVILVPLVKAGHWRLNGWQKFSIVAPLLAFLVVGLIVSVKIGGGGDLHNMDMVIIGLMFAGALAWQQAGYGQIASVHAWPVWIQIS